MTSLIDVFNHLVLPPKLSGEQDADIERTGDNIIVRLIHATTTLSKLASQEQTSTWHAVRRYLFCCQSLHARGRLEKQTLISELRNLKHDQPLILHVVEQNAALLVRYNAR